MCGCHDCKRHKNPVVILDWSKIPAPFNFVAVDGCSGEIWLYSDKPTHSITSDGGKFMPTFPPHSNEKQTQIGWVTQRPDHSWVIRSQSQPLYGIPELQISIAFDHMGVWFEGSLTNRPCRSRVA